jgi:hypothetical protein
MTIGDGSITVVFPSATLNVTRSALGRILKVTCPSGLCTSSAVICTRCERRVAGACCATGAVCASLQVTARQIAITA